MMEPINNFTSETDGRYTRWYAAYVKKRAPDKVKLSIKVEITTDKAALERVVQDSAAVVKSLARPVTAGKSPPKWFWPGTTHGNVGQDKGENDMEME